MDVPQRSSSSSSSASNSTMQVSPSQSYAPAPSPPMGQQSSGTDLFLRDFSLVAEAAKRAQMAVMMRDLDDFCIS
ncbi:hypothetical protein MN608_07918 [Microdochium nivale]|nr:hypothetical protein MN608_07918 [Microdochium nivale]